MTGCIAKQFSDQMVCSCGNVWDMNDSCPPPCKPEKPIKRTAEMWDTFFFSLAEQVATLSKDPDRKVGAVLVSPDRRQMSFGYNGFPPTIADTPSALADKELKLKLMVHAEDNCLRQAPFSTVGGMLYVTRFPCADCARKILKHQIAKVVAPKPNTAHSRWGASWWVARELMRNEGVELVLT